MNNQPLRLKEKIYQELSDKYDLLDCFDFIDNDYDPVLFYNWCKKWKGYRFTPFQRLIVIDTDTDYYPTIQSTGNNCYNFFYCCQHFDIPTEFIIFVSGTFDKHIEIQQIAQEFNLLAPIIGECVYIHHHSPIHAPIRDIDYNKQNINRLYSVLNGTLRSYRLLLLCHLSDINLLDQGYITYHFNTGIKDNSTPTRLSNQEHPAITLRDTMPYSRINEHFKKSATDIEVYNKHASKFLGKVSNYPELENTDIWDLQPAFLQNSLVNLVTETAYHYPWPHPSEKTLKPILVKRPFIIVGSCGLLSSFKSFGFKSFDSIWDESYDSITDPSDRMQAIVTLLHDLSKLDINTLINAVQPIVEFNFNHYKNNFVDSGLIKWFY